MWQDVRGQFRGLRLLPRPREPHHPAAMATTTSLGVGPRPSLSADVQGGLQVAAAACTACGSSAGWLSVRQPPSLPFGLGRYRGSTAGALSSSLPPTVRPWAGDPRPSHHQSQASAVQAPWGRSPPLHASLCPRVDGGPILAVPWAPHRPVGTVCGPGGKPAEPLGLPSQGSKASICSLESIPCHCREWGEALSGGSGWLAVFFLHPLCPPNSAS